MSSDPEHVRPCRGEVTVDQIIRALISVGTACGRFLHPPADPAETFTAMIRSTVQRATWPNVPSRLISAHSFLAP